MGERQNKANESRKDMTLKKELELIDNSKTKITEALSCAENDSGGNVVTLYIELENNLRDACKKRMNLI